MLNSNVRNTLFLLNKSNASLEHHRSSTLFLTEKKLDVIIFVISRQSPYISSNILNVYRLTAIIIISKGIYYFILLDFEVSKHNFAAKFNRTFIMAYIVEKAIS